MWGSFLARALTAAGIVVVIPDMRNYPFATVPDMVQDVHSSLDWTIHNIEQFGGDPTKIVVVGQSAGGHVACMAIFEKIRMILLRDDLQALSDENRDIHLTGSWTPSSLKGFASVSSPFSLSAMEESFKKKGLDGHLVDRIFGFENEKYDPFLALSEFQKLENRERVSKELPPIHIYHGSKDITVPYEGSETFYRELQKLVEDEKKLSFVTYPGWSHTDPILEGPMDADQSHHRDLFDDVKEWTASSQLSWPENDPVIKDRLCPHFLVQAGRFFNPF
jgi:prenylcysteine alpha-carboxyl methylesterase